MKERDFIRKVKMGDISYKEVAPMLDDLVDEVEDLAKKSALPDSVEDSFWDEFLIKIYDQYLNIPVIDK